MASSSPPPDVDPGTAATDAGGHTPLRLPALGRPAAVALVYLRAQDGGDFFADTPFCRAASELRATGRRAEVAEVFLRRGDAEVSAARLAQLTAWLRNGAFDLVVFEHLWLPELVDAVHAMGAHIVLCEPDAQLQRPVAFRLLHHTSHRQPLIDLARAWEEGTDLTEIPNLIIQLPGMVAPTAPRRLQPHPTAADARLPFAPVLDAWTIGGAGAAAVLRKTLDTNSGCPFSAPVAANPMFAGVAMPATGVAAAGCSFCFMGGDYRAMSAADTVATHLAQIAWYQQELPRACGRRLDEVVLRDQHALRYLPALIEGVRERRLGPLGILVPGRGDAILRAASALEEAAAAAAGSDVWFTLYLIGFESFSQRQLDLYNKGVRVEQYAEALASLRGLHRRFPQSFRLYAYGSSSFILWNPWTTLDDLDQTLAFVRAHAVAPLAHGLGDTRLRLYPHLPLWWKARAEGLLIPGDTGPSLEGGAAVGLADLGSTHTGYAAATPWRYADGRLARCEALARRLAAVVRPAAAAGALEAASAWTARHHPAPLAPCSREELESADGGPLAVERERIDRAAAAWAALHRAPPPPAAGAAPAPRPSPVAVAAARTVLVGRGCDNACGRCVGLHAEHDDDTTRLRGAIVAAARAHGRVVLAGREPLLLPDLHALIAAAAAAGAQRIELITNARALATPGAAAALARAGVHALAIKRHRLADEHEDVAAGATGAGRQQTEGIRRLQREAPRLTWRLIIVPVVDGLTEVPALAQWAIEQGARGVGVTLLAGAVTPDEVAALRAALAEAEALVRAAGRSWNLEVG